MQTLRVLVADEDPGMRQAICRVLAKTTVHLMESNEDVSFHTIDENSGKTIRNGIVDDTPDIVVLDHKLADMSGLDVLEFLHEKKLDLLTIMMSAYPSMDAIITATKLGAYDFLAKPFTPEELRASARKTAKHLILKRHARKLAEEKRQVRFQSISVLAHELKAPLASVEGYLNILKDPSTAENEPVYKRVVERSLVRLDGMRKLIMDLLDLTRIESGQKKRELSQIDLFDIAETAVETALPTALKRDIEINIHGRKPLQIMGDAGELEVIFNNLVSNAVKYNLDKGRVDIYLKGDDTLATIKVADTGIGMSLEETKNVFQEFYRAKNKKTTKILGSGLGLSIVKKLAVLYGGDASVSSIEDKGTTFTVKLKRFSYENNPVDDAKTTEESEGSQPKNTIPN